MGVNLLFEGLARAVEMANPAQEYCFLRIQHWSMCMTKAEWSGWMQVLGTIAAIFGAFYLSRLQEKNNLKRLRKTSALKIMVFVANISACAHAIKKAEKIDRFEIKRQQAVVREHLSVALNIQADLLESRWYLAFEKSRIIAAQLIVFYDLIDQDIKNLAEVYICVESFCDLLEDVDNVVRSDYSGIVSWKDKVKSWMKYFSM